ncbi:hypothetical protein ACFL3G_03970 [Planctomycetota bacterium]
MKDRNIYISALLMGKRDIKLSIKMRQSKLFGEKELILLEKRIDGNKKDPTGLWSRKVKPKVIEMVNEWMPRRRQLKKVVREIRPSCENKTICE